VERQGDAGEQYELEREEREQCRFQSFRVSKSQIYRISLAAHILRDLRRFRVALITNP
jgi:hypothetical protein